jgi:hypothetical protein
LVLTSLIFCVSIFVKVYAALAGQTASVSFPDHIKENGVVHRDCGDCDMTVTED